MGYFPSNGLEVRNPAGAGTQPAPRATGKAFGARPLPRMTNTAKILLIEDDPGIVMTLRRVLTEEGHHVQVDTRGDTGMNRARGEPFDVVITDMKLPGLSGLELVAELHGGPAVVTPLAKISDPKSLTDGRACPRV